MNLVCLNIILNKHGLYRTTLTSITVLRECENIRKVWEIVSLFLHHKHLLYMAKMKKIGNPFITEKYDFKFFCQ